MPRRWLVVAFVLLVLAVLVGLLIVGLVGQRANQNRVYSLNNMRELGQFALLATRPDDFNPLGQGKDAEIARIKNLATPGAIPAGTLPNEKLKPEERLSWIPLALPYLNQRRQDTNELVTGLDRTVAWDTLANQNYSRTVIRSLIPTAINDKPDTHKPAPTYYLGNGGIGPDGATLPASHARAGCFRYDNATPFAEIGDGLHHSIMFVETGTNIGPWLQGGPSTIRMLDVAAPIFGSTGQFGGVHTGFAVFGYADGSAGVHTDRTDTAVIRALVTINGGKSDSLPGE